MSRVYRARGRDRNKPRWTGDRAEVQLARQALYDLVLNTITVGTITFNPARPDRQPCAGIDQLDIHTPLVALHVHVALQDISHLELGAEGGHIDRLALIAARGLARDHAERSH